MSDDGHEFGAHGHHLVHLALQGHRSRRHRRTSGVDQREPQRHFRPSRMEPQRVVSRFAQRRERNLRSQPHALRHAAARTAPQCGLPHDSCRQGALGTCRNSGFESVQHGLRSEHRRFEQRTPQELSARGEFRQPALQGRLRFCTEHGANITERRFTSQRR